MFIYFLGIALVLVCFGQFGGYRMLENMWNRFLNHRKEIHKMRLDAEIKKSAMALNVVHEDMPELAPKKPIKSLPPKK